VAGDCICFFILFDFTCCAGGLTCFQDGGYDHPSNLAIVTPMNFESMPIGSVVSQMFSQSKYTRCNAGSGDRIRADVLLVAGAKVVRGVVVKDYFSHDDHDGVVYTIPELEARGLGFVKKQEGIFFSGLASCYINGSMTHQYIMRNNDVDLINVPTVLGRAPNNCDPSSGFISNRIEFYFQIFSSVFFVKIGNAWKPCKIASKSNGTVVLCVFGLHDTQYLEKGEAYPSGMEHNRIFFEEDKVHMHYASGFRKCC